MAQNTCILFACSWILNYSWVHFWDNGTLNIGLEGMDKKKHISLNEDDLLKVEQIVLDHDKDGALEFVKEVIKKQIDRENASKMKREGI